jgi:hypothetical protein
MSSSSLRLAMISWSFCVCPLLQEIDQLKGFIPQALVPEPLDFPDRVEPGGLPVDVGSEP